MIEKFKKSTIGQVIAIFFISASVTSGVLIYVYEQIIIPIRLSKDTVEKEDSSSKFLSMQKKSADDYKIKIQELSEEHSKRSVEYQNKIQQLTEQFKRMPEKSIDADAYEKLCQKRQIDILSISTLNFLT